MSAEDDLRRFQQKMEAALNELAGPKSLKVIGQFEADLIKRRTRLGYGVPKDLEPKKRLEPLAPSTIKARSRKDLAAETSAKRSNLTETGQLLNDIVSRIEGRSTIIGHKRNRNRAIGSFHQEGAGKLPQRRYLGLAKEDLRQVRATMQDMFTDILNRLFK